MHRRLKQEAAIQPASAGKSPRLFDSLHGLPPKLRHFSGESIEERLAKFCRASERRIAWKVVDAYDFLGPHLMRRISRSGTIRVLKGQTSVCNTLREDCVAPEEAAKGAYDLHICD